MTFPSHEHAPRRAFTLIEIMVAIGIIAVIMAIGIPSVFQKMHKDSMRLAVSELREVFTEARARAVLDGSITELQFRPLDRTVTVIPGAAMANKEGFVTDGGGTRKGTSEGLSSMKFSDHIYIEFLGVNLVPDLEKMEVVSAFFYPNGTADELTLVLRSDVGEIRQITTDAITGTMDMEVKR